MVPDARPRISPRGDSHQEVSAADDKSRVPDMRRPHVRARKRGPELLADAPHDPPMRGAVLVAVDDMQIPPIARRQPRQPLRLVRPVKRSQPRHARPPAPRRAQHHPQADPVDAALADPAPLELDVGVHHRRQHLPPVLEQRQRNGVLLPREKRGRPVHRVHGPEPSLRTARPAAPHVDQGEHFVHARGRAVSPRGGIQLVHLVSQVLVSAEHGRVLLADKLVVRELGVEDADEECLGGKVGDGDGGRVCLGDFCHGREDPFGESGGSEHGGLCDG
ncbi:hypothetical protein MAC_01077 [Metarhizium acridum CQMa 102]|uniref:Uncharacterized protein n=1 Tax=Metarhizium acridum (strain CQMa 102) TaxID=655827 RepID=E9DTX9_METAQ|nr:uncharacterized protein MAC_01077 [Metarhizium acridum CQMa 102]EFY92839.1 hypothetical protein MAC_01077 [Metarhizium acridum CQMa 102]